MSDIDYNERMKFMEMADEADRAKLVWLNEYMRLGKFQTAHMREANILMDAVERARVQMGNDLDYKTICADLAESASKARGVRLDSVKPDKFKADDLADQRKAFMWMADIEGMDTTRNGGDKFFDRRTQKAWVGFQAGYKMALLAKNLEVVQPPPPPDDKRKRFLS